MIGRVLRQCHRIVAPSELIRSPKCAFVLIGPWIRRVSSWIGKQFVIAPSDSITLKNVVIADPLQSESEQSDEALIKELQLEYGGDEQHQSRTCHRLRSFAPRTVAQTGLVDPEFREWLIDAKTLLPVLFEEFGDSPVRYEFSFDSIDEELPAETFYPPREAGLTSSKPEPLGDGYDRRFLSALDGSAARISVRWGKTGKGRTNSIGLN
jgi:hypothetical protein